MRCYWEEEDIKAGRFVIRESSPKGSSNVSFAASVTYKIGWRTVSTKGSEYHLVAITDGMITTGFSKAEMAQHLNDDSQGFRPLETAMLNLITEKFALNYTV